MLKKIFHQTFITEEEQLTLDLPPKGFDLKVAVILTWTALALAIIKYYGDPLFTANVLSDRGAKDLADSLRAWTTEVPAAELHRLTWWVSTMIFCYFIVPVLLIRLVFREPLSDYGFRFKGAFDQWWLYVIMLVIMVPLVLYFSTTSSFQARYPFYSPLKSEPLWPNFWCWEMMYFGQFIALEFFFRGFMTLGLRKRFGYYSIFIMTIPYCMIHFGKPMPETIGAIIAGIVLGTLSMKSRSVLMGFFIHYSVAITMDLSALWRKGYF